MQERRGETRMRLREEVVFLVAGKERIGTLLDLSSRGALVLSAEPAAAGSRVLIIVQCANGGRIHLGGSVPWCSPPQFGVEFGELGEEAQRWVASKLS